MQTNYHNLDWFESATISLIVIGIGLFSFVAFSTLDPAQQQRIASSFEILDVHQQVVREVQVVKHVVYELPQEYLDKFYLAFAEITTITPESTELAVIPNSIKLAYDKTLNQPIHRSGLVLGVSTETKPIYKPPRINLSKVELNLYNIIK